jgi:hypothetical protein
MYGRTNSVLGSAAPGAEDTSTILSPRALQEIARVEAEIDRPEAQAIERLAAPPGNQIQQIELLGKLMLYDKQLSGYVANPAGSSFVDRGVGDFLNGDCREWLVKPRAEMAAELLERVLAGPRPVCSHPGCIDVLDELAECRSLAVESLQRMPTMGEITEDFLTSIARLLGEQGAHFAEGYSSVPPKPGVVGAHATRLHS